MKSDFYQENEFLIKSASRFSEEYSIYRKDVAFRAAQSLSKKLNELKTMLLNDFECNVPDYESSEIAILDFRVKRIVNKLKKGE